MTTAILKSAFRDAMAACAAGVHVVTTDGEAGRYGITMTAVSSVTDEPPTVMLCINRRAGIVPVLLHNRDLCINVLAADQKNLAEHFAGLTNLSPQERFEYHIWHRGQDGQLRVDGALAHLHGSICQQVDIGTHHVFFVHIHEIVLNPRDNIPPLIYFQRGFTSITESAA